MPTTPSWRTLCRSGRQPPRADDDRERQAGEGDPDLGGPDRSDLRRGDAQEQERGTPDGAQVKKHAKVG